jgi:hypothetical protein
LHPHHDEQHDHGSPLPTRAAQTLKAICQYEERSRRSRHTVELSGAGAEACHRKEAGKQQFKKKSLRAQESSERDTYATS